MWNFENFQKFFWGLLSLFLLIVFSASVCGICSVLECPFPVREICHWNPEPPPPPPYVKPNPVVLEAVSRLTSLWDALGTDKNNSPLFITAGSLEKVPILPIEQRLSTIVSSMIEISRKATNETRVDVELLSAKLLAFEKSLEKVIRDYRKALLGIYGFLGYIHNKIGVLDIYFKNNEWKEFAHKTRELFDEADALKKVINLVLEELDLMLVESADCYQKADALRIKNLMSITSQEIQMQLVNHTNDIWYNKRIPGVKALAGYSDADILKLRNAQMAESLLTKPIEFLRDGLRDTYRALGLMSHKLDVFAEDYSGLREKLYNLASTNLYSEMVYLPETVRQGYTEKSNQAKRKALETQTSFADFLPGLVTSTQISDSSRYFITDENLQVIEKEIEDRRLIVK